MFGDIVSDLCAGLVGGLGFAPSANIGDNYAVFEPTHGSAPKYVGQYKVNPIAMLLTTKLMLDWLKEADMATRLESAIARVIKEGKVRTYIWAAKPPPWMSPKRSPSTPVHKSEDRHRPSSRYGPNRFVAP